MIQIALKDKFYSRNKGNKGNERGGKACDRRGLKKGTLI